MLHDGAAWAAAQSLREWLPKLSHPIREGEHHQTAFAFGLVLDWAVVAGDGEMRELLEERIGDLYLGDIQGKRAQKFSVHMP